MGPPKEPARSCEESSGPSVTLGRPSPALPQFPQTNKDESPLALDTAPLCSSCGPRTFQSSQSRCGLSTLLSQKWRPIPRLGLDGVRGGQSSLGRGLGERWYHPHPVVRRTDQNPEAPSPLAPQRDSGHMRVARQRSLAQQAGRGRSWASAPLRSPWGGTEDRGLHRALAPCHGR